MTHRELLGVPLGAEARTDDTRCAFDHCGNRADWSMYYKGSCDCPRSTPIASCGVCLIQYRDAELRCNRCGWTFGFGKVEAR